MVFVGSGQLELALDGFREGVVRRVMRKVRRLKKKVWVMVMRCVVDEKVSYYKRLYKWL